MATIARFTEPRGSGAVRLLPVPQDDGALVDAMRRGRPDALGVLFDRYGDDVRRVLLRVLGPDRELSDTVQEVFLAANDSIGRLNDPSALRSWLVGIAVFQARMLIRKRSRWWRILSVSGTLPDPAAPQSTPECSDAVRRTYAVLSQLPAKERIAFALRFIEGMDLNEIAVACGISHSSAKRHVRQAEIKFVKIARRVPELQQWLEGGRWSSR